jgi:uncharacterized protein (TIGR03067 family)
MASITVSCPSCEAEFAVKDTLISKKVDCPKCKYRFKVEEPGGDGDEKPTKAKKAAKKGGSNMVVIGGIIGLLAVILLLVGGYFIFSSGDSKPNKPSGGGGSTNTAASSSGTGGSPGGSPAGTGSGDGGNTNPNPPAPGGEAGATTTPGGEAPKVAAASPGELKNITNLLPGETVRIIEFHMNRLISTPLYTTLFDSNTQAFFKRSMTFDLADIDTYVHAVVNPDRTNFGVIRLKKPVDQQALMNNTDNVKGPQSPINGKYYYNTLKSNPFIDAIGRALAVENVADEFGVVITEEEKKKNEKSNPMAYHVVDSQTIIIADQLQLERFLTDLDEKTGYPPFKSDLTPSVPPATEQPMNPGVGGEGNPGGGAEKMNHRSAPFVRRMTYQQQPPSGVDIGGGGGRGQGGRQRPGGPGAPDAGEGQPGGQAAPLKTYTSNPNYRSVDEQLKFVMNRLEEEDASNPPIIVFGEMIDQRVFNQGIYAAIIRATNNAISGLISQVKVIGGAIRAFSKDKLTATAVLEFQNIEDARGANQRFIKPILDLAVPIMSLFLGTPIDVRYNSGGQQGGGGIGGPGPGGPSLGGPPGAQGGPAGGGGPGGRGMGGRPRPGGPGGGSADGGEGAGPGGPGAPGFSGGGQELGGTGSASHIDVNLVDKANVLGMEIFWNEEKYKKTVFPAIVSLATQMKGRMAVLSGETTWHNLAGIYPTLLKDKRAFPKGTIDRELKAERFGLAFPPEQRTSFLADLLPYLSKGGLRSTIKADKFPWYAKENISAAEAWIPEFLVPYYPQSSWRAYHPLTEGKVLGATNFVGLSGLGLDSARYSPADPEQAKKIGITGYDWGSTPNQITDGLSNTIYMIQVPPGLKRPWIAGGGATIVGVDDQAKNPIEDFVHANQDKKRGTYVLLADGSVRWVTESVDPKVFKGMVTRAGGENLGNLDTLAPKVDAPKKTTIDIRGAAAATPAPGSGSTPPPASGDVDAKELAKLQGDWTVRLMVTNGQKIGGEQLKPLGLMVKIEGDIMKFTSKAPLPIPLPSTRITKLDTSKSPKEMTGTAQDGPAKGQTSTSVYEFVGELKLNIRAAAPGQPLPKSARIPDSSSKDIYLELSKEADLP